MKARRKKNFFLYYGLLNAITYTHTHKKVLRVIILNRGFSFQIMWQWDEEKKIIMFYLRWHGERWKTLRYKKLKRWLLCDFTYSAYSLRVSLAFSFCYSRDIRAHWNWRIFCSSVNGEKAREEIWWNGSWKGSLKKFKIKCFDFFSNIFNELIHEIPTSLKNDFLILSIFHLSSSSITICHQAKTFSFIFFQQINFSARMWHSPIKIRLCFDN